MKTILKTIFLVLVMSSVTAQRGLMADEFEFVALQYPPYVYEEGDEVKGFVVDILEKAMKETGHTFTVNVHAWPRSLQMVKVGEADAIFTAYKNDEREQFLDYSNTVLVQQEVVFFKKKGLDIEYSGDLSQLANASIGIVHEISYGSVFDQAREDGQFKGLSSATTLDQNIRKFKAGRVDLLISNRYNAIDLFGKMGVDDYVALEPPVESVPSYIAFSKENDLVAVRDALDKALQDMIDDGSFQGIVDAYFAQ